MKTKLNAAVIFTCAMYVLGCSLSVRAGSDAVATQGGERYGTPAGDMPYDREIKLGSSTRSVGVARLETIKFVTAEGREFRWRFDTFRQFEVFPLAHIAPVGMALPGGATVYVNGDIPIAP